MSRLEIFSCLKCRNSQNPVISNPRRAILTHRFERPYDEVGLYARHPERLLTALSVRRLHLKLVVEEAQGRLRDVHAARLAAALHLVGELHILGVHVKLPLPLAQNSRQHRPRVDPHSHVHRRIRRLLDVSAKNTFSQGVRINLLSNLKHQQTSSISS